MPRISDPAEIRNVLETDRPWAIYALGDLAPGFFEHSEWFRAAGGAPALVLVYRGFETPVLLTVGEASLVSAILDEVGSESEMYLSIRPEILPLVKARRSVRHETAMWRMVLELANFRSMPAEQAVRLGPADLPDLRRLYDDGRSTGEVPDFFYPSMLDQGLFFGIREEGALVAAAGTHLLSREESVGAVGNVYTRRDRRGRGLGGQATSAVTAELLRMGLRTIALNVNQQNGAAIRVYERLGYRKYCRFYEGLAVANQKE